LFAVALMFAHGGLVANAAAAQVHAAGTDPSDDPPPPTTPNPTSPSDNTQAPSPGPVPPAPTPTTPQNGGSGNSGGTGTGNGGTGTGNGNGNGNGGSGSGGGSRPGSGGKSTRRSTGLITRSVRMPVSSGTDTGTVPQGGIQAGAGGVAGLSTLRWLAVGSSGLALMLLLSACGLTVRRGRL
jgi:hypothetical protein